MLLEKINSIIGTEDADDFFSETEDSESENTLVDSSIAFDKNIHLYVTCLMDLSPTMEQIVKDSNLAGEDPMIGPQGITFHGMTRGSQIRQPTPATARFGFCRWRAG